MSCLIDCDVYFFHSENICCQHSSHQGLKRSEKGSEKGKQTLVSIQILHNNCGNVHLLIICLQMSRCGAQMRSEMLRGLLGFTFKASFSFSCHRIFIISASVDYSRKMLHIPSIFGPAINVQFSANLCALLVRHSAKTVVYDSPQICSFLSAV